MIYIDKRQPPRRDFTFIQISQGKTSTLGGAPAELNASI
jgi:hypothetical protein